MSETAQIDENFFLPFSTALERASVGLVLVTGAMALAFLGAANAIWAYPYPRALLIMASEKSFDALKFAGTSALLPVILGPARHVLRASIVTGASVAIQCLLLSRVTLLVRLRRKCNIRLCAVRSA